MASDYGNIDHSIIEQFRNGPFEDQEEKVQKAFLYCMLTLMPAINEDWKRADVHANWDLDNRISHSDEAILYWFLLCNWEKWEQELEEEQEWAARSPGVPFPRRPTTKKGQHDSNQKFCVYVKTKIIIEQLWSNSTTGKGWNDAVRSEANQRQDEKYGSTKKPSRERVSYPEVDLDVYTVGCFKYV